MKIRKYLFLTFFIFLIMNISGSAQDNDENLVKLAVLEDRLAGLEHEIRLLEDSKAIKRLQRIYGYYYESGLAGELGKLFAEDATVELAAMGVYKGREQIQAFYQHLIGDIPERGELNNHIIMQGVVHVAEDGNSARGRWRALIQTGKHGESAIWSEGPYENEYVREDGVWKFSRIHWYTTFTAPYDPGWHKAQIPLQGPLEDFPPDTPSTVDYQSYPGAFIPPYHYDNPVSGRKAGGTR